MLPLQIVTSFPELSAGKELAVTTMLFATEHPVAVIVSVKLYVVVVVGEAVGFEIVELLNPVDGLQL